MLTGNNDSVVITVVSEENLILCDCNGSDGTRYFYVDSDSGLYTYCEEYSDSSTCNTHNGTHIKITGGVITGGSNINGGAVFVSNGSTFTMTGGTITGNSAEIVEQTGVTVESATFTMTGGYLDDSIYDDGSSNISISGGYFSYNPSYIAGGYTAIQTGNSTWSYAVVSSSAHIHSDDNTSGTYTYINAADATNNALTLNNGYYYLAADMTLDITISGTAYLCLNGKVLTGTGSSSVITVESTATLYLCDCKYGVEDSEYAHNHSVNDDGLYVFDDGNEGTIHGGVITGGAPSAGGGLRVSGTVHMYGGTIAGNNATYGGGVYISGTGSFNLYDGTIAGNTATHGGGVRMDSTSCSFNMEGGNIENNTATTGVGGLYVNGGTVTISDGTIGINTAAGWGGNVYVTGDGNSITITGGYFDGSFNKGSGTITITGGYLSQSAYESATDISAIASGYTAVDISLLDEYVEGFPYRVCSYDEIFDDLDSKIAEVQSNLDAAVAELKESIEKNAEDVADKLEVLKDAYEAADALINNNINSLIEKDSELEGKISDLESALNNAQTTLQGLINGLRTELNTAVSNLEQSIADNVSDVETKLEDLEDAYMAADAVINSSITSLTAKDSELEGSISDLESALNNAQTSLESLINEVKEDLEAAIDELEQSIADNASDVETKLNDLETAYKAADALIRNDITTLFAENDELEGSISTLTNALNSVQTTLLGLINGLQTELNTAVSNLEQSIADNASDVETKLEDLEDAYMAADAVINSSITSLTAKDSELEGSISNLESALNNAQTSLESLINNVKEELENTIAGLEQSIETNASNVASQLEALKYAYEAADALINSDIAKLNTDLSSLESAYKAADEAIWAAINALQADVAANTGDIDALTSQLQTLSTIVWALLAFLVILLIIILIVWFSQIRKSKNNETINTDENNNSIDTVVDDKNVENDFIPMVNAEELNDKNVVNFKINEKTFGEQFNALSKDQHRYFMNIRDYAMQKPNAEEQQTKTAICVKVNKKNILKLYIKRGITVASFKLENDLVKGYKRNTGATSSMIRQKETEIYVNDDNAMETVFGMIDLTIEQHEKECQEAKERKRAKQAEKRAQKKESNSKADDK